MSLFKKPKRNIRIRGGDDNEDGENEGDNETDNTINIQEKVSKKKATKDVVHQPVLSFHEDWNEGDDGEVFQVKKSSQSKRIKKILDRERKKKKETKSDIGSAESQEKSNQVTTDGDIVIKLKNTFVSSPILNGREAESAVQEGISSEEEGGEMGHTFIKQSNSVKMMLKRGKIPDAATIHAARKQRQHVREMGDFIPLSDEPSRYDTAGTGSRLIREDDNDASEGEEERINMAVNTTAEDRIRRRVEFHAAQDIGSGESDKGEEEEWEAQQIRKGVTGAQIAAVQQETMFYQQYMGTSASVGITIGCEITDSNSLESSQPSVFPPLPSSGAIDPQLVTSKLKDRLSDLREVHRKHSLDLESAQEEMTSLCEECCSLKEEAPRLADKFRYYQDLRGYVTDLVECLDEKIVVVEMLEQRVEALFSKRSGDNIARRRQDVMDQAQELAPMSTKNTRIEREEAQVRRTAEREGRRIRRQRARELKGIINHIEGMSSDEEVTEAEVATARAQREVIEQDAKHVFEDALDEFATVRGILQRFETWRLTDMEAYREAYVSLCLPKLLGPLLRLKLLFWNPIIQGSNELEKSPWCNSILLYGFKDTETEDSLRNDPDVQLLPRIIEKIVLPKLNQLISLCWDPVSNSQTVSLVGLVTRLMQEYPTLTHNSKSVTTLMNTVIEKMRDAVANDVFIPIYPKQRFQEGKVNNFFQRQCAVAVKLLGNLVCWQGILSDATLSEIALESLLNRYLLSAMRMCQPLQAVNICNMIGSVLPRIWLQSNSIPPHLLTFLNQTKVISQQLDMDNPIERDAVERMSGILRALP